ncbi:ABC transporter permease [Patescibacteria group bacterium]|nr:ABC transporter permease [Patescibacteria group bacterium]
MKRIFAIVYRHMVIWPKDLGAMVDSFWWPSFDMLLWGLMTVYIQRQQQIAMPFITSFIIGGIVFWMFVYRSQQEMGVLFLREFWDRNLLAVLSTPISITEYFIATMCVGILKLIISGVYMAFLGWILFQFNIFLFGWYLIPFILTLTVVGLWAGFLVMGLVIQYGYRVQSLAWSMIMIIMPFSAVFYPVSILPGWMQSIARFIPSSYVFESMRQVIVKGTLDVQSLLIANVLNLVYTILSCLFFAWGFRRAREKGIIVKFS